MAAYVKYELGIEKMMEGGNAGSDSWRLLLSNTAPTVATDTTAASITEIANGNGYTTGGATLTVATSAATAGVYKLTFNTIPTWTSSTGNMGPFRYVILYNLTQTQVIGYWDYGSALTLNGVNGDTFTPSVVAETFSVT
jgi:hypothetical protein